MPADPPCYSVGQSSSYIKGLFEQDFLLKSVQVEGEISNLKYHSSGHVYFTLKDEKAAISGIMFASYARGLKIRLKDGMKVRVSGSISTYERGSSYQIYAKSIAEAGLGVLYQRFMETKQRLEEMGLFDPAYRKPIPKYAMRIGVVTAPTGAAIQDIVNITHRRNPFAQLILYPALVQGEYAPASIIKGIETLDRMGLDILIVGRGGGSLEDLWAFNDERVARAIYASGIPVISAVGHEPAVTISDFVADRRASTPSNAAEIAVPDRHEIEELLASVSARLNHAVSRNLQRRRQQLESLRSRGVLRDASSFVDLRRMDLDRMSTRLASAGQKLVFEKRRVLVRQAAALDAMSPLKVLSRGYVAANDGQGAPVKSVRQLRRGDRVTLRFSDGRADCLVEQLEEENRHGT